MNSMQKILVSLVVLLILINVVLIGFIWRNRPSRFDPFRPMPMRTESFFENQLDFDEDQLTAFRSRMVEHKLRMDELQREIRLVNRDLHEAIILNQEEKEEVTSQKLDSLAALIKLETTDHIRSLATICRPEQRARLIEALNRLPDRRGNRGQKLRRRRHQE